MDTTQCVTLLLCAICCAILHGIIMKQKIFLKIFSPCLLLIRLQLKTCEFQDVITFYSSNVGSVAMSKNLRLD